MILIRKAFIFSFIVLLSSFKVQSDSLDTIISAIQNGNEKIVADYFDRTVEISLPDIKNSYSKIQAEIVLKDFFNLNSIINYSIFSKSYSFNNQVCYGKLETKKGIFFLTIILKTIDNKSLIQEIKIETKR